MSAPSYAWFNGPVRWYYGANTGTALALPADTVEYGTSWTTGIPAWTDGGKTQGEPTVAPEFENRDLETDQDDSAIHSWRTANSLTFKIPTLDVTLDMLKRAHGQGTLTSGASEDSFGMGGNTPVLDFYSIGFEGYAPGGAIATPKYRRLVVWKATPTGYEELKWSGTEETILVITWKAYLDTSKAVGKQLCEWVDDQD